MNDAAQKAINKIQGFMELTEDQLHGEESKPNIYSVAKAISLNWFSLTRGLKTDAALSPEGVIFLAVYPEGEHSYIEVECSADNKFSYLRFDMRTDEWIITGENDNVSGREMNVIIDTYAREWGKWRKHLSTFYVRSPEIGTEMEKLEDFHPQFSKNIKEQYLLLAKNASTEKATPHVLICRNTTGQLTPLRRSTGSFMRRIYQTAA